MKAEEELTSALAALQRRSPEELAAFIVSMLCSAPPGVRSYIEAFIAAAEPFKVATIVRREISALRVGERDYDVRHRRSAEIVARAGYTLGAIERVVLPSDVALAQKLLSELLDASQQIAEQCYEGRFRRRGVVYAGAEPAQRDHQALMAQCKFSAATYSSSLVGTPSYARRAFAMCH